MKKTKLFLLLLSLLSMYTNQICSMSVFESPPTNTDITKIMAGKIISVGVNMGAFAVSVAISGIVNNYTTQKTSQWWGGEEGSIRVCRPKPHLPLYTPLQEHVGRFKTKRSRTGINFGHSVAPGFIFHGPTGTGKTTAAREFAALLNATFITISMPNLLPIRWVGTEVAAINRLFSKVFESAEQGPTVLFIDEVSDINRDGKDVGENHATQTTNTLLTLLEKSCWDDHKIPEGNLVVIFGTNNLDSIDSALKRSGRLTPIEFKVDAALTKSVVESCANSRKFYRNAYDYLLDKKCLDYLKQKTPADIEYLINEMAGKAERSAQCNRLILRDSDMHTEKDSANCFVKLQAIPKEIVQDVLKIEGDDDSSKMSWEDQEIVGDVTRRRHCLPWYKRLSQLFCPYLNSYPAYGCYAALGVGSLWYLRSRDFWDKPAYWAVENPVLKKLIFG